MALVDYAPTDRSPTRRPTHTDLQREDPFPPLVQLDPPLLVFPARRLLAPEGRSVPQS